MGLKATPLVCGHFFTAGVPPRQAGERVWCHTCFDYRRVLRVVRNRDSPDPAPRPRKPKTAEVEDRCGRGHERTPENTYWRPKDGNRACRLCQRQRDARRKQKRRENSR